MREGRSEAAQLAAARELLDRAWGKPRPPAGTDSAAGTSFEDLVAQASEEGEEP